MKVLLSNTVSRERFNCIPDLGLGYLLALARQKGHEAHFVDCLLDRLDVAGYLTEVEKVQPDLVGLKVYSIDIAFAAEMIAALRERLPTAVIVIGGPHPSTEHPDVLWKQLPELDYAFAGEAEAGFPALLGYLDEGAGRLEGIPGLLWRDEEGTVQKNPPCLVEELHELPFPAWDLIDPRRYPFGYSFMTYRYPAAPMVLTRGCPHQCTYCGSHFITGRHVRERSIDNVIEEIQYLRRDFGVISLDICDENMALDYGYATEFCERLLETDTNIHWNLPYGVRLDCLDADLVQLMERAGCYALSVGIESGSDRILEQIKKRLTVAQIREQMAIVKQHSRMMVQGYFMMGFPTETKEEIEETIDLACSLPLDIAVFHPLRVTPGTEIYADLEAKGLVGHEVDYAGMGNHYFVRSYCDVDDDTMKVLYRKAYRRFYARPGVLFNLLSRVRTRAQLNVLINAAARLTTGSIRDACSWKENAAT